MNTNKKKKKIFTKHGTLFSSNSRGDLRSDAYRSQIIGGDADGDHSQIIGKETVKLLGGYISLSHQVALLSLLQLLRILATQMSLCFSTNNLDAGLHYTAIIFAKSLNNIVSHRWAQFR